MASKRLKTEPKEVAPTDTYILLDRSGSMTSQWAEATSSINTYVNGLAKREVPGTVTLALFDDLYGQLLFEVVRRHPASHWAPFTPLEYKPRGNTPLFDAIARMVNLAEVTMPSKAVIVIMTDGAENASLATSNNGARMALDRCRHRGWQVVFLGANFDQFSQGQALGTAHTHILNAVPQAYGAVMESMSAHTHNYSVGGGLRGMSSTGNVEFTIANRVEAAGNDNKPPKPKSKAA